MKIVKFLAFVILIVGAYFLGVYKVKMEGKSKTTEQDQQQVVDVPRPKIDVTKIPVSYELWEEMLTDVKVSYGEVDAPVILVAFVDADCPNCEQYQKITLPKIMNNYVLTKKLRILSFPYSKSGSKGSVVDNVAKAANVGRNPTFFVGMNKIEGVQPYIVFESLIEKELEAVK